MTRGAEPPGGSLSRRYVVFRQWILGLIAVGGVLNYAVAYFAPEAFESFAENSFGNRALALAFIGTLTVFGMVGWWSATRRLRREYIFISYRRSDSATETSKIHEALARHFGGKAVFIDVCDVPPAVDFRRHVEAAIAGCDIVLVIMGPLWARGSVPTRNRIHEPEDLVRQELEAAIHLGVPVLPVFIEGVDAVTADLPEVLRPVCHVNGVKIEVESKDRSFIRPLIDAIEGRLGGSQM